MAGTGFPGRGQAGVTRPPSIAGSNGGFTRWCSISATIRCSKKRSDQRGAFFGPRLSPDLSFWTLPGRLVCIVVSGPLPWPRAAEAPKGVRAQPLLG